MLAILIPSKIIQKVFFKPNLKIPLFNFLVLFSTIKYFLFNLYIMILYNKIHFLLKDHNVNTSFYKLVLCHPANNKSVFFSVFVNIHEAMNIFNLLTNFYKKQSFEGVLRNFAKFTGKHLCQSLHFNKAAGLRPATLLKKRL